MTENQNLPKVNELAAAPEVSEPQPTLEDLIRAAEPIASAWFKSQERMHERSEQVEEAAIRKDTQLGRATLIVITVLSLGIMVLAGLLIVRGNDQSAKDLIQLVVSLAAAGFGGYGLGRLRGARAEDGG